MFNFQMKQDAHIHGSYSPEFERAMFFAAKHYEKATGLIKPVFAHGLRVGMIVFSETQSLEAAQAGILHDLIEDTDVTFDMLAENFGEYVALLVKACSVNPSLNNNKEDALRVMIQNVVQCGEEALVVKVADIYDNFNYYRSLDNKNGIEYCLMQGRILREGQIQSPLIRDSQFVQDLLCSMGV